MEGDQSDRGALLPNSDQNVPQGFTERKVHHRFSVLSRNRLLRVFLHYRTELRLTGTGGFVSAFAGSGGVLSRVRPRFRNFKV